MHQRVQSSIFHIGFHKTGTTYLQESIFPYATNTSLTRGWANMRDFYNSEPQSHWLHSDESISGKPWGGKIAYGYAFTNNLSICMKTFGVHKYIITVRPLESWTKSLWKQHIHEGGHVHPKSFFNGSNPILALEDCFMAPKIEWLKNQAEVLVISQQELKENELRVAKKISTFTGIQFDMEGLKSRGPAKELNVGISSERQTRFLLKANKINKRFRRIHPQFNLDNRLFRKVGLTPRHIAQNRLKGSIQSPFKIDFDFSRQQLDSIRKDWDEVQNHL